MTIKENIALVKKRMEQAARRSGRSKECVELVAVSKKADIKAALEVLNTDVFILGESRVQEAKRKFKKIGAAAKWHLVGSLQTNKAKYCPGLFDLIHSVDRIELFKELDSQAKKHGTILNVLLQVNVSGEKQKSGCDPNKAEDILKEAALLQWLTVRGLMTIPPLCPDPENSRSYYKSLVELKIGLERSGIEEISLKELSMGMSNDYEVAIEEGATLVRVGNAIFGNI
ncbi:MAG TPA: YggS family pyridoxal phosphate-dependent enzyme [Nitrospinota bacterium]|nr:YggS family pyridoxal phosphate-dependent enzyme [Nitrospinota bacterium]|tara:strand:- start:31505 stop:32188 length:684 start_codon:yes stop_codon:yes gene_type:complete